MGTRKMTISAFARAGGVGVETVRYYQRRGLLPVPGPRSTSYREYDETLLRQLVFIRRLKDGGFTLAEIAELLRLDRTRDRRRVHALATRKLADVQASIREQRRIARSLKTLLSHCDQAASGAPCPIIESFDHPAVP